MSKWPVAARLSLLLPGLLALLLFYPVAGFDFVWDDDMILLQAAKFVDWELAVRGAAGAFLGYQGYFRPLPLLMLALEQGSIGTPALSHLVNLALHATTAVLVALVGAQLAAQQGLTEQTARLRGVLAGSLFALHPAVIEPVAWLSCRFELLVTWFCVLILYADLHLPRAGLRALLIGALFFLAALSKEMAAGFALTLPLWHLLTAPPGTGVAAAMRNHALTYVAVLLAGSAYLSLRAVYLPQLYVPAMLMHDLGATQHALLVLQSLGQYVLLALMPFTQISPLHTLVLPLEATRPLVLVGGAAAVLTLIAMGLMFFGQGARRLLVLPVGFVLTLLPVLNILPLQIADNYAHDRFVYLPLVFFCLGAVQAFSALEAHLPSRIWPKGLTLLVMFWFSLSALNVHITLPFWKNNLALWTLAYMRSPDSASAQAGVVSSHIGAGQVERAFALAREIASRHGRLSDDVEANLLMALAVNGYPIAERLTALHLRLERDPQPGILPQAIQHYLGWLYLYSGNAERSAAAFERSLQIKPGYPPALYGSSVLYAVLGEAAKAQEYCGQWQRLGHPAAVAEWNSSYETTVNQIRESWAKAATRPPDTAR